MVFRKALLLSGLLLAAQASASASPKIAFQVSTDFESDLRRDAEASLERRQLGLTPASGDAARLDLDAWNAQTRAACETALRPLNGQATNPSGLAVCYNLPFLDNRTGIFQAELRMYNISAPTGDWEGIVASDVSMTLSYLGATVQAVNVTSSGTVTKRDGTLNLDLMRRGGPPSVDSMLVTRQNANAPVELKAIMYVGRLNSNVNTMTA